MWATKNLSAWRESVPELCECMTGPEASYDFLQPMRQEAVSVMRGRGCCA